jgi:hypothetical protein
LAPGGRLRLAEQCSPELLVQSFHRTYEKQKKSIFQALIQENLENLLVLMFVFDMVFSSGCPLVVLLTANSLDNDISHHIFSGVLQWNYKIIRALGVKTT